MTLAQLGPLFLLSPIGGMAADRFDRRTLLVVVTVEQTLVALIIAWLTDTHDPRIGALFAAVLASGIGQAFYAPTFSALIPTLVERKDLPGAISLNSANMNLSRVIGPAIGGVLYAKVGAPWAFVGQRRLLSRAHRGPRHRSTARLIIGPWNRDGGGSSTGSTWPAATGSSAAA